MTRAKIASIVVVCGALVALVSNVPSLRKNDSNVDPASEAMGVTLGRMPELYYACNDYYHKVGAWPPSLAVLAATIPLNGTNPLEDGWGHKILLVPATNAPGAMRLISYGPDGKPGGTGTNGDIVFLLSRTGLGP